MAAGGPVGRLPLDDIRVLADADVLVAEPGCDAAVLAFARRDALRLDSRDAAEGRAAAGDTVVIARATPTA